MSNISRRGFLSASAVSAGLLCLTGCDSASDADGALAAPASDSYPIEPEEWGSGTVRYTTEVAGDERLGDGWTRVSNEGGVTLGVMDASKLIQVDGYAFKDLDGDGKLSLWEDWRQSADDRAAALAETMSAEQIAPLMANFSIPALNTDFEAEFTSDFMNSPTSTMATIEQGVRTVLMRMNYDYQEVAHWVNLVQEACEADNGIPMMCSSDPVTFGIPDNLARAATFDPSVAKEANRLRAKAYRAVGVATELGPQVEITTDPRWCRIGPTFGEDPALVRDMARAAIDGFQSTYDDDGNDQGWGADSVICEVKHFPGDGSGEGGRESHKSMGKYQAYPNDNFPAHLISFFDGAFNLDGQTGSAAAVMPSYAIAFSENGELGELVGSAYSEYKIGLLRNNDFDGIVCTDWGVVENLDECFAAVPWGVENLTRPQRIAKLVVAGVDQVGGGADLSSTLEAYKLLVDEYGEEDALTRFREIGRRIVKGSFLTGLFDNPYVVVADANDVTSSDELSEYGAELARKGIVMLKNAAGVIQQRSDKPTVYVPMAYTAAQRQMDGTTTPAGFSPCVDEELASEFFTVVTDTVGEPSGPAGDDGAATYVESDVIRASADEVASCDFALVCVSSPASGGYGGGYDEQTGRYIPLSVQYGDYVADGPNVRQTSIAGDPADGSAWSDHDWSAAGVEIENRSYYGNGAVEPSNRSDLDLILDTVETAGDVPVVVGVTADRPMVFGEFEPRVSAILMSFDSESQRAMVEAAAGVFEPSGLLPLQQPLDMNAVEAQSEDLPRDMECYVDADGNEYDFGFGLNWSGVISDERTETYCVDPLSTPETITV